MAKKNMRQEIIIDMDEFIVTYAATLLDPNENLSQLVYNTAKDDITKWDDLFHDQGFGRKKTSSSTSVEATYAIP